MAEANVYYCWVCDAHRKAALAADGRTRCPRCQHELTSDARLPLRTISTSSADGALRVVWPAPVRPRLAASA